MCDNWPVLSPVASRCLPLPRVASRCLLWFLVASRGLSLSLVVSCGLYFSFLTIFGSAIISFELLDFLLAPPLLTSTNFVWVTCQNPRALDCVAPAVEAYASSGLPVPWTRPCWRVLRCRPFGRVAQWQNSSRFLQTSVLS